MSSCRTPGCPYTDLFKVIAQLNDRRRLEHPLRVDDELAMLERVDVAFDEEQIGAGLDGQKTRTRDVDSMSVAEVLDRSSSGSFEL